MKISITVLKKHDRPDGIFTVNDLTGIGVMKIALKLGLHIPNDIKIAGFGNSQSSSICQPELTSVDQFGFELGKKATSLLLKRIKLENFEYESEKITIKTQLIVRGST
jgi:DNA-binding LacI/PurR family transcriptional regulator